MTLAPATVPLATLLPGAGRLMGRQFLGFCVMFFCLPPHPSFSHLYLSRTWSVVVQEKTPHTGSLSVRTIRQKSLGVGCPLLTLSSQLLLALPAQARLHVGWFEILPSSFLSCLPSYFPSGVLELGV